MEIKKLDRKKKSESQRRIENELFQKFDKSASNSQEVLQ